MTLLAILALVALVLVVAVTSAAEASFTRISRARADVLVEQNRKGAATLRELLERRQASLGPVVFLSSVALVAIGAITATFAGDRWGSGWVALAVALVVLVVFVFAVALPKARALADLENVALRSSGILRMLRVFAPAGLLMRLVAPGDNSGPGADEETVPVMSEEMLLAFAKQAEADEAIHPREQELIEATIKFDDTVVSEVMVPRTDMITIRSGFACGDAMEVALLNGFSRLPITGGGGIDEVIGVALAKDLMRNQLNGRGRDDVDLLMRKPHFVPETKRIAQLLREMQRHTFHLAVVVDEYGGTAGMVTLEDLIEELVGEIVDEFDVEEPVLERLQDGAVRVNGRASLAELERLLDTRLPDGEYSTVGGLIFTLFGRVPEEDESLVVDGHELRIEQMVGTRIARVRIDAARSLSLPDEVEDRV